MYWTVEQLVVGCASCNRFVMKDTKPGAVRLNLPETCAEKCVNTFECTCCCWTEGNGCYQPGCVPQGTRRGASRRRFYFWRIACRRGEVRKVVHHLECLQNLSIYQMEAKNSYGSANVVGTSLLSPFTVKARLRHCGQRFSDFKLKYSRPPALGIAVSLLGLRDRGCRDFSSLVLGAPALFE